MIGKIFKAYDVRATYPDPLNELAAKKVGFATGQYLKQQGGAAAKSAAGASAGKSGGNVALVSRDMRPHSPSLCQALSDGLRAAGLDVVDLGMCDTSFMYFAVNYLKSIGGIQTTASHNPVNYNGFKFSGREARPIGGGSGLEVIQSLAEGITDAQAAAFQPVGGYQQQDIWDAYRTHVLRFVRPLRRKLRVFIDGSNGMAGKMVPRIFDGVPNLEIIPVNFEITGSFVHDPNPLVPKNMVPTQEGVKKNKADLGACFDGDADRCMLTDEKGQIIGCDHLTALLCEHFLNGSPGGSVIYDLRSSKVVEEEIRRLGGTPLRSRVGHVYMKALLRKTGAVFGGELSGHFYFRDNFCADSGAIAFAAVLSVLSATPKTMSQLIAPFKKYPQSGEINFHVADKVGVMAALKTRYAGAKVDELDGVTVDAWDAKTAGGFWFNVRASNTEPLLRLNAEAKDRATLDWLLKGITPLLGTPEVGH